MGKIDLVLYGASGHAKVILEAVNEKKYSVVGFFDDDATKKVFKDLRVGTYSRELYSDARCFISIGDNRLRERLSKLIEHKYMSLIAESALVSHSAQLSLGTFVAQRAVIQSDTTIGAHCIINTNASVDHDCFIEDYVHIAPGATLCGGVHIGEGTLIGAGAVILPNIKIGKWCVIGAGSVITKNIINYSLVKGNPAK